MFSNMFMLVFAVIVDMMKKNNLRIIEDQIVKKRKNEARSKFTGSYIKKGGTILKILFTLCNSDYMSILWIFVFF